ncbi:ABC-2 type transport system ATP-binding protein [Paenibacillus sp. yr247]|uniref:ABC transporter ATP-binding protein n=1 Tax=Paenibacillus sp. yr247 TaxID=1761880 RepID=UPI0008845323|nr:ABC-2 type transport system ATP-binding protein [Paenibacillus sp. yr247]
MNNTVYDVQQVCQTYNKGKIKANEDISFRISEGEILGILGPNGAGKTTLMKLMVGHLKPTSGRILFYGEDVGAITKKVAGSVAYFSQEPHVLHALKAWEALAYTGRLRGMAKREAENEAEALLEQFGIAELRDKPLKKMSGGQKRLIGIGTALIGESPVLILDEPTNELDPQNRRLIWSLIKEKNRAGATVLLVTHNILEAEQVVDRVAVINCGRLLAIDSVGKLKQRVDQRLKFELALEPGGERSGGIRV